MGAGGLGMRQVPCLMGMVGGLLISLFRFDGARGQGLDCWIVWRLSLSKNFQLRGVHHIIIAGI